MNLEDKIIKDLELTDPHTRKKFFNTFVDTYGYNDDFVVKLIQDENFADDISINFNKSFESTKQIIKNIKKLHKKIGELISED